MPPKRKAVQKAELTAKRAKGLTDLEHGLKWTEIGEITSVKQSASPLYVLHSDDIPGATKLIGFDLDFTLVRPKNGKKFASGRTDWEWLYPEVATKLKELNKNGFRVIIFTNQMGIEKGHTKVDDIKLKLEDIIKELGIPVFCFISTGNNQFRKPSTRMWEHMVDECNRGVKVDLSKSKYVGDAAGRVKDWAPGKPKDFTCSDRMFASNVGVAFQTPEEFFLGEAPTSKFDWRSVNPADMIKKLKPATGSESYISKTQEMVLLVGCPASGKSTFARRYFLPHGYVHINRDTLGTQSKCMKAVREALESGKSVIIDNTNPSVSVRSEYLVVAEDSGISARCFVMDTPLELAHHLNLVRQTQTDGKVRRIPGVGYNMYKKNFAEPTKNEGFTEVIKVDFRPKFDKKSDETLFNHWTSD